MIAFATPRADCVGPAAPIRTWKEVAAEFNRRNPGAKMDRHNAQKCFASAQRKIVLMHPELAELLT